MEAEVGVKYTLFIPGEPVPKSTQAPPRVRDKYAREWVIQTKENYASLKRTMDYQRYVADFVKMSPAIPWFDKDDPIAVGFIFFKAGHALGDLKNLEAGVEDGMQYSGKIPNDRQIVKRLYSDIVFYAENPGVALELRIRDEVRDEDWLYNWLSRSRKRVEAYKRLRGL